ncbi:MAG: alanine dehydrogenase [Anaerolineae bacterium]|jgi:alanine dehydrogenase|nr:alanine dehydrogenase [Anaerolineae bacterium]MBT7070722.1 alanine dehydrogenase [Anaerolineae bacterium]MBT7324716.1 alanine dehydrogenase [Anaerolineae bacterium]
MNIGIPKERRPNEYRVGLSPAGVKLLLESGKHQCFVEHEAGRGAGFRDLEYERAGASIVYSPEEVFGRADLMLKLTRPMKNEIEWLRPNSAIAAFLHLASARQDKLDLLLEKKITAIAYEQIQEADGTLPVLRPLSQVGGTIAAQTAARLLQNKWGGRGILLGMIPGVPPAEVIILGAGVVGSYAARAFRGLGAHVTVLDNDMNALQKISEDLCGVVTMVATPHNIERATAYADVVLGAVLNAGTRTPVLVTRKMVRAMKPRSVILDVSIDQGGCFETSRPTTHENPVYIEEEVTHYCVPNLSGVVARTATHAFVNAAIPYLIELANRGIEDALENIPALEMAASTHNGEIRHLSRHASGQ